MEHKEIACDENYNVQHFITEDNRIEFGFYRVLFGIRFRAGYTGDGYVHIDWCCGDSSNNMIMALAVFIELVKTRTSDWLFNEIPSHSEIKPFHKDPEFMEFITSHIKEIHRK